MGETTNIALQFASRIAESARQKFMPAQSNWRVLGVKDPALGIDVADAATLGITAVVPVNVDVKGGGISIKLKNSASGEEVSAIGIGAGASVGLGWQIPFLEIQIGRGVDVTDAVTSTNTFEMPGGGVGHLWTGPSRSGILSASSFEAYCAVAKVEANYGPNAVAAGIVMFSSGPITKSTDLVKVFAFGLVTSIEWALEVSIETGLMNYKITQIKSQQDGARQRKLQEAEKRSRTA